MSLINTVDLHTIHGLKRRKEGEKKAEGERDAIELEGARGSRPREQSSVNWEQSVAEMALDG